MDDVDIIEIKLMNLIKSVVFNSFYVNDNI